MCIHTHASPDLLQGVDARLPLRRRQVLRRRLVLLLNVYYIILCIINC